MCKFALKMPTWIGGSLFFEAWGWNSSLCRQAWGKVDWKLSPLERAEAACRAFYTWSSVPGSLSAGKRPSGRGFQSGTGSSRHNGASVSAAASSSGLLTSLVSASLVLVHLPHPGRLSRPFPFLKNFILSPGTVKQHPWPWSLEWRRRRCWFLLCLVKDWEVKGLMGAVKPIPNKALTNSKPFPQAGKPSTTSVYPVS